MHGGQEAKCRGPLEVVLRGCQQTRLVIVAVWGLVLSTGARESRTGDVIVVRLLSRHAYTLGLFRVLLYKQQLEGLKRMVFP